MSKWNLFYKGSVKDIYSCGNELIFQFSDRYSVFDWGAMPDDLENKGKALAILADFFFRHLDYPNHGIGLCDENGENVSSPDRYYKVNAVEVLRPQFNNGNYDYEAYQQSPVSCLVPLEVIFRFGIPKGSSLLGRIGKLSYREQLGLDRIYEEGEFLPEPIVEFSTKLESTDRYLTYEEAQNIAGLSDQEFQKLINDTKNNAAKLKEIFKAVGVVLWDGKFEYAFNTIHDGQRDFRLVDSVGPDELRLSYEGMTLSKEFLRQYYRTHQWYLHVQEAKKIAEEKGIEEWKKICLNEFKSTPPKLDIQYKETAELIYLTLVDELCRKWDGKEYFKTEGFEGLKKKYESLK